MCKENKNYQILENIIFSKQPKKEFYKWYNRQEFKNYIDNFLPEINACIYQEQKSVWHLYNVFEHTLVALKKANSLSKNFSYYEKQIILYSVFFHDIGKPFTVVEKFDKQGNMHHGFPSHNLKSAEIFNRVKSSLNLSENQTKIIENLILNHDIFNEETRPIDINFYNQLYNEVIKFLDEKHVKFYFKSLIIIVKSDNFAQNRAKTKPTLNKVLALEKLLSKV